MISCGADQTAVVTKDGELFVFGRGQDSRLGSGESAGVNETLPILVEELRGEKVVYVDAGYMHMGAITDDGVLWTWGKNTVLFCFCFYLSLSFPPPHPHPDRETSWAIPEDMITRIP